MNSERKESRKFLRVKTKLPIRYQIKRGGFSAGALSEDLSLSGARLNADRSFPSGLNLNLELNILLRVINPVARVVWSKPAAHSGAYRMGIEFIEISPEDKNHLCDYINTHLPESIKLEK